MSNFTKFLTYIRYQSNFIFISSFYFFILFTCQIYSCLYMYLHHLISDICLSHQQSYHFLFYIFWFHNMWNINIFIYLMIFFYRIEGLPEGFNQNPLSVSHVTWLNEDNIILVLVDQSIGDHSIICNGNIQKEDAIIKIRYFLLFCFLL